MDYDRLGVFELSLVVLGSDFIKNFKFLEFGFEPGKIGLKLSILSLNLSVFAIDSEIDFVDMVKLEFELFIFEYHWNGRDLIDKFGSLLLFGFGVNFELFLIEENFGSKVFELCFESDEFGLLVSVFDSELFELLSDLGIGVDGVVERR